MRQLDDVEIYQPLVKDPTIDMIKKINEEAFKRGNIDKGTQEYLMASWGRQSRTILSTAYPLQFVDHHLRPLVPNIASYIKDTNHFLRKLKVDVVGLYPHIPHGLSDCMSTGVIKQETLNQDIVDFVVLKNNNF